MIRIIPQNSANTYHPLFLLFYLLPESKTKTIMAVVTTQYKAKKVGSDVFEFISVAAFQTAKIDTANGIFRIGDVQYQLSTLELETTA